MKPATTLTTVRTTATPNGVSTGQYLLRRLAISVPVLLGITLAVYVIISLAPGDPVDAMINPEMAASLGPGYIEQQREELGLNQPILVRYAIWLKEVAQGNLGYSVHGSAVDRREDRRAALADTAADGHGAADRDRHRHSGRGALGAQAVLARSITARRCWASPRSRCRRSSCRWRGSTCSR